MKVRAYLLERMAGFAVVMIVLGLAVWFAAPFANEQPVVATGPVQIEVAFGAMSCFDPYDPPGLSFRGTGDLLASGISIGRRFDGHTCEEIAEPILAKAEELGCTTFYQPSTQTHASSLTVICRGERNEVVRAIDELVQSLLATP